MPIDPSIVSNAFVNAANNMPDMNALMQQRVQGAENIYQIETARQAQAAQAEKEAAQQAAEAMLPAVASAFYDPSDAGLDVATTQLPPEVATVFTPFMQRLKSIPDVKQRLALLRAELAKDDEGRYILGQLEPTANMRLQEATAGRRAALDERRLALEEARLAAEAEGGGTPDYEKIVLQDGTLGLLDRKTGRISRPTMEGGIGTELPPSETAGEPIKIQTEETKQQAKEQVKLNAAFPKASKAVKATVTSLDQDIADVKMLLKDRKGLAAITGTFNAMTPDIMADATRAAALYDKITAGAGFTALGDLKAASPTGGALGAVSDDEGRRLRASVATFSRKQTTPDFVDGLERYLVDLEMSRENVLSAFDETYSYREDADAASIAQDLQTQRSRLEQEIMPQKPPLPPGVTVKKRN